jgi:hypothetical protein
MTAEKNGQGDLQFALNSGKTLYHVNRETSVKRTNTGNRYKPMGGEMRQ